MSKAAGFDIEIPYVAHLGIRKLAEEPGSVTTGLKPRRPPPLIPPSSRPVRPSGGGCNGSASDPQCGKQPP